MSHELAEQVAGVGALVEPARRELYLYVASQPDAVSREQAATAVGVPLHSAKFHLDRLVEEDLLEELIEFYEIVIDLDEARERELQREQQLVGQLGRRDDGVRLGHLAPALAVRPHGVGELEKDAIDLLLGEPVADGVEVEVDRPIVSRPVTGRLWRKSREAT